MSSKPEHPDKPTLDAGKAPYGHPADPPLAPMFPAEGGEPAVDLLGDGVTHAHEALDSFAEGEGPVFPPSNVAFVSGDEPAPLPSDDADDSAAPASWEDIVRGFVRSRPLVSVLAAAVLGALIVRASR